MKIILLSLFIAVFFSSAAFPANPSIIWGSGGYAENLAETGLKFKSGIELDDETSQLRLKSGLFIEGPLRAISTTDASSPCPSMTEAQRDLLSVSFGDCVSNSTTNALNFFDGTGWVAFGADSTLQGAYESSSDGEITVNATLGPLKIYDNATPLVDPLFKVMDNSGATTYFQASSNGAYAKGMQINGDLIHQGGDAQFYNKIQALSTTQASSPCPIVSETQRDAMTPMQGECVFNTTTGFMNTYDGSTWKTAGADKESTLSLVEDRSFEKGVAGLGYSADLTEETTQVLLSPTNTKALRVTATDTPLAGKLSTYTFDISINSEWHEGMPITVKGWIKWPSSNASGGEIVVSDTIDDLETVKLTSKDEWQEFKIKTVVGSTSTIRVRVFFDLADGQVGDYFILDMLDVIAGHEGDSLYKLSGAHFVGSLMYETDNSCVWTGTSTTPSTFSVDSDCVATSVKGSVSAPDTAVAGVKIPNARTDGYYQVESQGLLQVGTNASGDSCYFGIAENPSDEGVTMQYTSGDDRRKVSIVKNDIRFSTGGDKTVQIVYYANEAGHTCQAFATPTINRKFTVHFFPDEQSTVVTQTQEETVKTANEFEFTLSAAQDPTVLSFTNFDIIASCTETDATYKHKTCTFENVTFTEAPSVKVTPISPSYAHKAQCLVSGSTTTSFSYSCMNHDVATDYSVTVEVTKQGSDYNKTQVISGSFEAIKSSELNISSVEKDTNSSVSDMTWTVIPDLSETVARTGKYLVHAQTSLNGGGTGHANFRILVDGATAPYSGNNWVHKAGNDYMAVVQTEILDLIEGQVLTIEVYHNTGGSKNFGSSKIDLVELPDTQSIVENLSDNTRLKKDQYSTTEMKWGKWNGEQLYRRCFTVGSDIATTTSEIVQWDAGLKPKGIPLYYTNSGENEWAISFISTSSQAIVKYNETTGDVNVYINGSYKVGAGSSFCMDYTK